MPYVAGKMRVMSSFILSLLLLLTFQVLRSFGSFGSLSSQYSSESHSCNSLSDVKVNNTSIFEAGNAAAGSYVDFPSIPVKMHLFLNPSQSAKPTISSVNEWITQQQENTSLMNTWIRKTRVNVADITFRVYLPSSVSSQVKLGLANLSVAYNIINDSEWKKLGRDTICMSAAYSSKFQVWFNGSEQEVYISAECSANNCLPSHWQYLCKYGLKQGDIFQFSYMPFTHGNISMSLYTGSKKVYISNNHHGNYTLPKDGGYYVLIDSNRESAGIFKYNITYRCKNITSLIDELLHSGFLNIQEINVLISDTIRVKPTMGRYESIIQSPFQSPGILMLMIRDFELEYLWTHVAEAFGAGIQEEGS